MHVNSFCSSASATKKHSSQGTSLCLTAAAVNPFVVLSFVRSSVRNGRKWILYKIPLYLAGLLQVAYYENLSSIISHVCYEFVQFSFFSSPSGWILLSSQEMTGLASNKEIPSRRRLTFCFMIALSHSSWKIAVTDTCC
jgi:hypothetical protein